MAATASSIELSASETPIPVCMPHLMPFHIKYTGPAPISTYFRPKAAPQTTFGESTPTNTTSPGTAPNGDSQVSSESQDTLVPESQSEESPALTRSSTSATLADIDMSPTEETRAPSSSELHLAAAFRGRAIRGLTVALPEGYAGVVLSSSDKSAEAKSKPKTKKAPASKRGSKRTAAVEETDEDEDEMLMAPEPSGPVKTLEATGTFSSFVLWNADNPVDEGRDEYLRTLTEWTKIAAEIHRYDD